MTNSTASLALELCWSGTAAAACLQFSRSGKTQLVDLVFIELAEFAGLEVENEWAIAYAADLFYVEADLFEELADLAVAAFDEDDFVPGVIAFADLADLRGGGAHAPGSGADAAALDDHAAADLVELLFRGGAGDFDEVGLFHAVGGLGERIGELAVVSDQEQAFAEIVEAAYRVEALALTGEKLHHRWAVFRIADRGDVAFGLVQNEIADAFGALEELAVDANVVAPQFCFRTQLGDNFAIELNTAREDHLFSRAAGGYAGFSENFL